MTVAVFYNFWAIILRFAFLEVRSQVCGRLTCLVNDNASLTRDDYLPTKSAVHLVRVINK